jgi:uncharacterized protein (UPF0332 family)
MSTDQDMELYLQKSVESLLGAESECANRRFSNCANRAYYAAFQAAISALIRERIQLKRGGLWKHDFVQAEFVGRLINRGRQYPPSLRTTLPDLLGLRNRADYRPLAISELDARRALRKSSDFVVSVRSQGENRP